MDRFIQHGNFHIDITDGVLVVDATGPFNQELIEQFNKDLSQYVDQLCDTEWVELAVLRLESAYTPDALQELSKSIQWRVSKGMRAIAILFVDPSARILSEHQLTHTFKKYPLLEFAYFDSKQAATDWCQLKQTTMSK